jgi:hypothetical protein
MRRIAALIGGMLLLGVPAATAAPVAFTYTASTHVLRYGGAGATVSVAMRTGAAPETVSLGLEPSSWQDRDMFGSPLATSDQRVTGAGRITSMFASSCCDFAAGVSICQRGGPPDVGDGIDLALPANSTTRVSYRVRLAAPPWPAPIFLGVVVGVPAQAPNPTEIDRYQLGPQRFMVRGPTGVHIKLTAGAGARREPGSMYPVVAPRRSVVIAGTTNPRVAGARLQLGYASTTNGPHGAIGTVTTDSRGAFRISWRPPATGTFTITSAYRHPARGLLADGNCDLALTVG